MNDISLGAAILIGLWVFFVTARAGRETSTHLGRSLTLRDLGASPAMDDWSFDPSKDEAGLTEQADGWVLR